MENLALNKPVTASDISYPYTPARAVDGIITPFNRWQSNTVPCWLTVDLGICCFVNRWVMRHLPTAGWAEPQYVNTDFQLQVSNDNRNWTDVDYVTNNTSSKTDRYFKTCYGRYFRIFITKGLKAFPKTASIIELELYKATEL